MRLKDKVTIITGGSRGIGFATADKFLSEGAKVIITASSQASADKAVAQLQEKHPGSVVAGIAPDLSSLESVRNAFRDMAATEDQKMVEVERTDALYPADSVIISISQGPRNTIVSTTTGLDANDRGLLIADECGRTTRPGVFASGDVVKGVRTVVEAVAYSKRVAEAMHEYIQEKAEC